MKKFIIVLGVFFIILIFLVLRQESDHLIEKGFIISIWDREYFIPDSNIEVLSLTEFETKGGDRYFGYSLQHILAINKISDQSFSKLKFISNSGESIEVDKSELQEIYLIDTGTGKEKFYRVIIRTDLFSRRWLRNVIKLELF